MLTMLLKKYGRNNLYFTKVMTHIVGRSKYSDLRHEP